MSDFVEKAKDAVDDVVEKVKGSEALGKAEDVAEEKAAEGGAIGDIAENADDAIDTVQGTKD